MSKKSFILGFLLAAVAVVAMAQTQPIASMRQWEITCAGSAGDPVSLIQSGQSATAIYVANDSTTCVRVGGVDVTASTGFSIGDGCRDGTGVAVDAKSGFCLSSGVGTVTVDVIVGKP